MKKKLLSLLGLFLLILPIAAGCGEDTENQVEVSTSIVRPRTMTAEDVDYDVNDCARILDGSGTYTSGQNARVRVEVNTAACKFYGWVKNETEEASDGRGEGIQIYETNVELDVTKYKKYYIQAIVSTKTPKSSKYTVNFTGIYKNSSEDISFSQIKFPELDSENKTSITYQSTNQSFNSGEKLTNLLTGNEKTNLNYIYVNDVFQPYKLQWKKANIDSSTGMCVSATWQNIDLDPNAFVINENLCLRAELKNDASNRDEAKLTALTNFKNSEVYMSKNESPIAGITSSSTKVSSEMFYAYNLKYLYTYENPSSTLYIGVNDAGYLERVRTQSDGNKSYSLCREDLISGECSNDSSYLIEYNPEDDYSQLAISPLLEKLKTNAEVEEIEYIYDYLTNDINVKSLKFEGMDKYYVAVVHSLGNYYNATDMNFSAAAISINAAKYNILFAEDTDIAIETRNIILEELNTLYNKIQKYSLYNASKERYIKEINEYILDLIYKKISEKEELKSLKNYQFTLDVDMDDIEITINTESAIVNLGTYSFAVDKYGLGENEYNVCPADSENLLECIKYDALAKYVTTYLTKSLEDLYKVEITRTGNITTYVIQEENGPLDMPVEITYDATKKMFTMGNISLQYVSGEAVKFAGLSKIELEDITVLGTILQTLEVSNPEGTVTVTTTLNESPIASSPSIEEEIRALHEDLKAGTLNMYDENSELVLSVEQADGSIKMYTLRSITGKTYEITYGENENKYTITVNSVVSVTNE